MQSFNADIGPERLRRRALRRLLDTTRGDGLTYQLRTHEGQTCYAELTATGEMAEFAKSCEGAPLFQGSVPPDDPAASIVRQPERRSGGGFMRFREDRDWDEVDGSAADHAFYRPFEITDHLRTLFYAEGMLIGYIAALRRGGERFSLEEQLDANRLIPEIYDDLQLAWTAERALINDRSLHLVLDERWNVVFASPAAAVWLTGRRRDLLRTLGASKHRLIDGMRVATTRLESTSRGWHYASLSLAPLAGGCTSSHLSSTQRLIAELAAKGLTNGEIGAALDLSASTVKYHLSGVFQTLGISSRSELATAAGADKRQIAG